MFSQLRISSCSVHISSMACKRIKFGAQGSADGSLKLKGEVIPVIRRCFRESEPVLFIDQQTSSSKMLPQNGKPTSTTAF